MNLDQNNMYLYLAIAAGVVLLFIVIVAGKLRRKPKKLNTKRYHEQWTEVQGLCKSKNTWPLAIINGDKLLDDALKARRYKGKTMGERLVAAQRDISDNDSVWFGHKLRNKLVHEETPPLKQNEVMKVLTGFRQALKDLGAL
ncbi:MAG: hypothetical protein ABIR37_02500 [Candidatus Saccharimonadales bacterium]